MTSTESYVLCNHDILRNKAMLLILCNVRHRKKRVEWLKVYDLDPLFKYINNISDNDINNINL